MADRRRVMLELRHILHWSGAVGHPKTPFALSEIKDENRKETQLLI